MNTNVEIIYLGHSAFKLRSPAGKHILIDPFLSGNPLTPEEHKTQDEADYILLTHGHEDHVGDTLEIAKKTGAKVVSIVELSGLLKADGLAESQAIEMNKGGSIKLDDVTVSMTNANHSSSFGGRYAGDPAGLMLRFDNDITIYHAGDTNIMPDFEIYSRLYKPQVSLLPMGDYYTMGPAEAAMAAAMLKSDVFVPIHHSTFPPLTGTPEEFKTETESLTKGASRVHILKPGETLGL